VTPSPNAIEQTRSGLLAQFIARRSAGRVVGLDESVTPTSSAGDVLLAVVPGKVDSSALSRIADRAGAGYAVLGTTTKMGTELPELLTAIAENGLHVHFSGVDRCGAPEISERTLVLSQRPPPAPGTAPPGYRVLAVMTTFNEGDVIEGILDRAAAEGLWVHVVDNWSTDDTLERATGHRAVLATERFPPRSPRYYEWERLLHRVEEIAATANADWVVHHDADEWRTSAWPGVPIVDALYWTATSGYNAVDHTVVVHPPTHDQFVAGGDVTGHLRHFEFGRRPGHFIQIKAWQATVGRVDLASSGGHEARFASRRIFPANFLLRHYPIRSQAHGMRKVLEERRPRWAPGERQRGWHNQYDSVSDETQFLRDPTELDIFDEQTFYERYLLERLARIGIRPETP
jgi:Glycosyl transferase family 2